jgi:hypothetical protein
MKDTLEYKILKYLFDNDNVEPIEISHLNINKKFLREKLNNLKKEKHIKCRVITNENIIAKIEFKGVEYLNKIESENNKIITNTFNNSTIGQLNQSDELSVLKTEIKQTIHPTPKDIKQNPIISFIVKCWWQILVPLTIVIIGILIERGIIDIGI